MADRINSVALEGILARLANDRKSEPDWAALYRTVWLFVISTILRTMGGYSPGLEDVAQDVFLRLVKFCDFSAFPSSAAFLGYLHAICRNAARDFVRINRPNAPEIAEVDLPAPAANQGSVDSRLTLEHAFKDMTEEEAKLANYLLEGYTLKEIADRTKETYGALAVRFHRLRLRLRTQ